MLKSASATWADSWEDRPVWAALGSGLLFCGRPSYHPSVLLKLYIYGYLNRVQSSRRLEREAGRNVEVIWLTGRLVPDHKTTADFRKDNGAAIRKVCARFIMLCRALGLFAEVSVAIDGSKFKAVNNRDRTRRRAPAVNPVSYDAGVTRKQTGIRDIRLRCSAEQRRPVESLLGVFIFARLKETQCLIGTDEPTLTAWLVQPGANHAVPKPNRSPATCP